jgi:cation diffusion facilitator family transporter
MTIELIGGYIAGSLAIMTDAAHLLSDLSGFIISMLSLYIALTPANSKLTYGYHRAEIIGALVSILIIWILTGWLLSEAIDRLYNPHYIKANLMMIIAGCGLLFNLIMAKVLMSNEDVPNMFEDDNRIIGEGEKEEEKKKEDQEKNPILRATIIHILGDIIQSIGVLTASIIIYIFEDKHPSIVIADPICTFVFGIIVLSTSIPIAKDCITILMEATPENLNQEEMIKEFKNIPDIVDFHDIHIWSLSLGKVAMTAHFISNNPQKTLESATEICRKYGVFHSTIQVEDYTQRRRRSFKLCNHINDNQLH